MAIAPRPEQLNSAPAMPVAGKNVESVDQLLAEVRAKIETQLNKTEREATKSQKIVGTTAGKAVLSASLNALEEALERNSIDTLSQPTPALARALWLTAHADSPRASRQPAQPQRSIQSNPPAFETLDVQKMAAAGYFQAIAYWLNEALIPQNVYAKVLADDVPGRIKVLVEFERTPQPKRLVRFVCDRLYRLNSNVIEGVHILARPIGTAQLSWEKAIRIPTAQERVQQVAHAQADRQNVQANRQNAQANRQNAQANVRTDAKTIVRKQFKLLRTALVGGSALLALALGSFFYLFLSDRLLSPVASRASEAIAPAITPAATPWYGKTNEPDIFQPNFDETQVTQATAISFRPASRFPGRTVEAARETVAVIPHKTVANPSDPTVTLMFGGELAFNDFIFKDTTDLDNLFSEIDIYEKADVAMVSLAEPLAHASTSLQETFYQRTRPQATQALKSGGIDIVGLAGDGSMAHGAMGLRETLNNLDRQGIYRVGAGRNQQEAHRPEILEVKGQRIAYFGYSSDALKLAEKEKAGVALNRTDERSYIQEDIEAVRDQVDWIVVNYRWGDTQEAEENAGADATSGTDTAPQTQSVAKMPADWQQALAHEAVDAGADLVVGSHPTQIQGVEVYRDRPIAYSLGNFAFSRNPETDSLAARDTAALKVSLRNQRMKVELLPITLSESKLKRASGQQGTSLLQSIRNASRPLAQPLKFPAVLKPDSRAVSPQNNPLNETIPAETTPAAPAEAWLPTQEANPVPEAPNAMPGVLEVIQIESESKPSTEREYSAPASNPMMKESEALFMQEEDTSAEDASAEGMPAGELEESTLENKAPAQTPAQPLDQQLDTQQLDNQQLDTQQLDAQWQNEDWQHELQNVQDTWEGPSSSVERTSSEPYSDSQLDPDVAIETTPTEAEMYPWQDPFAQNDSEQNDSERSGSLQNDALQDSWDDNWSIEERESADDSIRPYAEPLVGPLSSEPTPFTSNL